MENGRLKAFNNIKENKLIAKRQWEVYLFLFSYGPCTAGDISLRYKRMSRNHISARITEMVRSGIVKKVSSRKCIISGKTSGVFNTTDQIKPSRPSDSLARKRRFFWIAVYKNEIITFTNKKEANDSIKKGLLELIEVREYIK